MVEVEGNVDLGTRTCICLHPRNKKRTHFFYMLWSESPVLWTIGQWTVQIQIQMHSVRHDSSSSLASFLEILPNMVKKL